MEILPITACPYEDYESEVLNFRIRLEEREVLTEGKTIQIEMMDLSSKGKSK